MTREAIADGQDTCPITTVPATDVEGAVVDHFQTSLAAPTLVARTWAAAKREGEEDIIEHEVTVLLADFATVWSELFPAEQARGIQLLVARVDVLKGRSRGANQDSGPCEPSRRAARGWREEGSMIERAQTRLDGSTLVVRIPIRFQPRGGRRPLIRGPTVP